LQEAAHQLSHQRAVREGIDGHGREPRRPGGVGVDADHGNAPRVGGGDQGLEPVWLSGRDHDPVHVLAQALLEGFRLSFPEPRVVAIEHFDSGGPHAPGGILYAASHGAPKRRDLARKRDGDSEFSSG
jgi:hypothetical protein